MQQPAVYYVLGLALPASFLRRRSFPHLTSHPALSRAVWALALLGGLAINHLGGPRCGLSTVLCSTHGGQRGWGKEHRFGALLLELACGTWCTYTAVQMVPIKETVFSRAGRRSLQVFLFHNNLLPLISWPLFVVYYRMLAWGAWWPLPELAHTCGIALFTLALGQPFVLRALPLRCRRRSPSTATSAATAEAVPDRTPMVSVPNLQTVVRTVTLLVLVPALMTFLAVPSVLPVRKGDAELLSVHFSENAWPDRCSLSTCAPVAKHMNSKTPDNYSYGRCFLSSWRCVVHTLRSTSLCFPSWC